MAENKHITLYLAQVNKTSVAYSFHRLREIIVFETDKKAMKYLMVKSELIKVT